MTVKITVIIPTFNRYIYLKECLDSITSQTLHPCQVIIVNDGSNDQTLEILKSFFKSVDYIETNQVGKAAALNAALGFVKGEYVWIFDDDDVAFPDALERFAAPLESNPEYGFSYSTYLSALTQLEDNRIGSILGESKLPDLPNQNMFIPLMERNFLGGASLFARTECYHRVGNFDPILIRSEDYEMALRISRQFTGVRVAGGPTFYYRQHQGLRGSTSDRFEAKFRSAKWLEYDQIIFRKLYHELTLADYLPKGYFLKDHVREAHLQKLAVMASKLLIPEVLECLEEFSQIEETSPFSTQEREILRRLIIRKPYYKTDRLYDSLEAFNKIRSLSFSSPAMRRFRSESVAGNLFQPLAGEKAVQPAIMVWGCPKGNAAVCLGSVPRL